MLILCFSSPLLSQIEFANVILINKTDLVTPEELGKIEGVIRMLNPSARIFKTVRSKVPLKEIFNTNLFDFDEVLYSLISCVSLLA